MPNESRARAVVCLTGFMGSGKSTVARLLARQIGWPHVDLDRRIVEAANQTIPEIFAKHGTRGTWYAHAAVGDAAA